MDDLEVLADWFHTNKLTLNLGKSGCVLFTQMKHHSVKIELKLDSNIIPLVHSTKFLGIHLDDKLTWNEHYNHLLLKITRNMNMLKTSKKFLSTNAKKLVYYGHIFSHLNYCNSIWGSMLSNEKINKLQKLQNKCIHLIDNSNLPLEEKFCTHKIIRINELIKFESSKVGYKVVNKLLPPETLDCFTHDHNDLTLEKNHCYSTIFKHIPNAPLVNGKLYYNSFLRVSITNIQPLLYITHSQSLCHFSALYKDKLFAGQL